MIRGYAEDLFLNVILPSSCELFAQVLHDVVRELDTDEVVTVGSLLLRGRGRASREGILRLVSVRQAGTVDPEGPELVGRLPVGVGRELGIILEPSVRLIVLIVLAPPLSPGHLTRLEWIVGSHDSRLMREISSPLETRFSSLETLSHFLQG